MLARTPQAVLCIAALLMPATAIAQSFDKSEIEMFQTLNREPNDLARYTYLTELMPQLPAPDQIMALQMLATAEDELGLYDQAILGFPLTESAPANLVLPTTTEWQAADAADAITKLAANHRIVLINEAHHNAHTRQLTLALLPRLRAMGFTYFAAEALGDKDPGLVQRGYPVKESGTEYLREPLYGEIVREAIRLGFIIVPYDDASDNTIAAREAGQASNLYQRVFAKDPQARLFVHCGYAHIDKAKSRLGDAEPMAMRLGELTGFDPLSIDQTQFLEVGMDQSDAYHRLVARFPSRTPFVLINRVGGKAWSASPKQYDVNVILPAAVSLKSFGEKAVINGEKVQDTKDISRLSTDLISTNDMQRPSWLTLDGERYPVPISGELCRMHIPCAVEARYVSESDSATAADRYAFMESNAASKLYLRPGRYRLRALSGSGTTLSEQVIQVAKP
jgi:hypothetical protein